MKAASYPDFGLELLVPEQMWIDDVCSYDVSAKYGISHWWFTRQKFYIDRHDSSSHRKDVRTHMRILSVVRIKAYSRYIYDYLSEIILRRADHQEHMIAKKDFKNMYPSDFKDLNLLLLQGHLDHLSGSDKQMLSTAIKLWTRNLVIRQRVEDFQLAVVFLVNINERKIMRLNEIYKFSDGTLTCILETLDYRVKEFKIKQLNPVGLINISPGSTSYPTFVYFGRSGLRWDSASYKTLSRRFFRILPDHRQYLYRLTGNRGIPMVAAAGQKYVNSQPHAHTSHP
ncbi:hypothetical protein Tco_0345103 [Tanacetum coccineum]